MENDFKIDFVMIWVDDSDPEWRKEKAKYSGKPAFDVDARDTRYRDWNNLKYWFRAVETYAPWVNKVYFVTCGHVPDWLNLDAPKLVHVKHADYMPQEYLPTFSSHPIELCINRIQGLSEHFVYFNDDTFIGRPISPAVFFKDGKPVHTAHMHSTRPGKIGSIMPHIYLNCTEIVNEHFDMKTVLKENKSKWFSISKNGVKTVAENILCSKFQMFPGFTNEHLAVPVLKSTMDQIWSLETERLDTVCKHRFRDVRDVSSYVFRYWDLASGNFEPVKIKDLGVKYTIASGTDSVEQVKDTIINRRYNLYCINDNGEIDSQEEFEESKKEIVEAFEIALPNKSSFEK